ncbi:MULTISPECIES: hypothetical protein [Lysinibacillus]|uniref:Uncharacterized protein n=2 Tax=Lysinibacillus TaxID=400634 RepID=B1HRD1_LYSSC|nr:MULTISPECIES: hypothetical protein [Lysinibacillus]ACA40911.1 hypothetical protein Bsph_3419 [Lysinibacillus sphaericus C3-41]MCS1397183.1 hypothetical protein [Lysinibacillus sp. PB211]MDR0159534.1 hypothetical protein [Lysinibacillus sphaericus]
MVFSLFKKKKDSQPLKNRVEFCMTNLSLGAADAYDVLLERDDFDIEESGVHRIVKSVSKVFLL